MGEWRPPIVSCVASAGDGVDELWARIREHRWYLESSGELHRRRERRLLDELRRVMVSKIEHSIKTSESGERYESTKRALLQREIDPYDAADDLLTAG
jgi:LAO/AO transport system kinase